MPEHPLALALLIILVILSVIAGLWFGNALGSGELSKKMALAKLGEKLRAALRRAVLDLWRRRRDSDR
ncbi:MAG: hypothetical protein KC636_33635 [Myxococcales bacterium]|nr:hypothetical protein [Myxococcales bacterium]